MGALLIVATLAAQVGTTGTSTPSPSTDATAPQTHAGQTTYADFEVGAGYSTNPNMTVLNDEGAGFGRISVHAVHSRVSALATTLISAYAENASYTNHHGSNQSASLFGRHDVSVSEHTRLFVDGSATYQENGQLDTRVLAIPVVPPATPGGPVTPPILLPSNSDFLSIRGHQSSFTGHAGGSFELSPRDSFSLSSGAEHVVFHSGPFRTIYTTIPVSIAYDRQLSERTTVGARVTGAHTDYNGPASSRVITPQFTARTRLAPNLSFDGALGVSFARFDDGLIVRNSTGLSAQANLCGQGETSVFCAHVGADEQTATTAGPTRSISGGVDYSTRLDANQSIQFSLGVTHYSMPTSIIPGQSFSGSTYYHVASTYSRQLGSRFFGGVNLAARKLTQNGPDPKTDLNVSLFVRYRLGDI